MREIVDLTYERQYASALALILYPDTAKVVELGALKLFYSII